jgi:transcriptional regulator with XRE-family HTH domain
MSNTFGKQLKALRVAAGGVTQAQLAGVLEVEETYVSKIERDDRTPSATFVIRVANYFASDAKVKGVDVNQLLALAGHPTIERAALQMA